jgi:hypothetical protein
MKVKSEFRELFLEKSEAKMFFVQSRLDPESKRAKINLENYLKNRCIKELSTQIKSKTKIDLKVENHVTFFNLDDGFSIQAILIVYPRPLSSVSI